MLTGPTKANNMYLDTQNFTTIAAHFNFKFKCVQYVGCWSSNTVTFALWQDREEKAGVEITIEAPKGDVLEQVKVIRCRRLKRYSFCQKDRIYKNFQLPIIIPQN